MPVLRKMTRGMMVGGLLLLAACGPEPVPFTPTPTWEFTAPTLEPSPTIEILDSLALYGTPGETGAGISNPTAQAFPSRGALPPVALGTREPDGGQRVQIALESGAMVPGLLYAASLTRLPGVMILARDTEAWRGLAQALRAAEMAVLIVEPPAGLRAIDTADLLLSFSEENGVDPARLALVGAEDLADQAFLGCAVDELCDLALLLSPLGRETLATVMSSYNPRPLLVAASTEDANAYATGASLVSLARGEARFIEAAGGVGAAMLAQDAALPGALVGWMQDQMGRLPAGS